MEMVMNLHMLARVEWVVDIFEHIIILKKRLPILVQGLIMQDNYGSIIKTVKPLLILVKDIIKHTTNLGKEPFF